MSEREYERRQYRNLMRRNAVSRRIVENAEDEIARVVSRYNVRRPENFKWSNNRALEHRINNVIGRMNSGVEANITRGMVENWNLSNVKYDEFAAHYMKNAYLSSAAGMDYFSWNNAALNSFINRSVDGVTLADRIWRGGRVMKDEINTYLGDGIAKGLPAQEIARDVKSYLKEPNKRFRRVRSSDGKLKPSKPMKAYKPGRGIYKSARKNAERLTRTEINMAYRTADYHRRKQMDFVTGITVHLSAAHPEYDICDEMEGDYPKNFKFLGWHPHCYCYTTSKMLRQKDFLNYLDKGTIPGSKVRQKIPLSGYRYITKMKPRLKNYKSKPYWLKDNFKDFTLKKEVRDFKVFRKGAKVTSRIPPVVTPTTSARLLSREYMTEIRESNRNITFVGVEDDAIEAYNNSFMNKLNLEELHDDMKKLAGPGTLNVRLRGRGAAIEYSNSTMGMERSFRIENGRRHVHHDYFVIRDEKMQGKGFGKKVFRTLVKHYERIGIQDISVYANIQTGAYAWGRYGFRAEYWSWQDVYDTMVVRAGSKYGPACKSFVKSYLDDIAKFVSEKDGVPMDLVSAVRWENENIAKKLLVGNSWHGFLRLDDPEQAMVFKKYLGL